VSHQGLCQDSADVELIVAYPEIFPNFYMIPTPHLERDCLSELREFTLTGLARLRWILVAVDQSTSGILDIFMAWRRHRLQIRPDLGPSDVRQYYRTDDFCADFASFVRTQKVGEAPSVKGLLDYQDALRCSSAADTRTMPAGDLLSPGTDLWPADIPVRGNRIVVFELARDIQRIVDALKLQKNPVQSRGPHFYITRPVSAATARIDRISKWMAYVLRLCDGRCSVKEIVQQLTAQLPEVQESLREYVCMRLLQGAQNEQFIEVYRTACASEAPNRSTERELSDRKAA
jgi:hypothetical protein